MTSDGYIAPNVLLGGGIGAGKSSIARLFADSGYMLIDADRIGADILAPHTDATVAVEHEWPEVVHDGVIDRSALARIVFVDAHALELLESITHPAIAAEIDRRVASTDLSIIVETPVRTLGIVGDWLRVAVVAEEDTRIARAIARGGDPEDVRRRVASQISDKEWTSWADVVIDNNRAWGETEQAAHAMIRGFRE
jgi:dephospho-CoA kinase